MFDDIRLRPLCANGLTKPIKAPPDCPHCIAERDCSSAPLCAAVSAAYVKEREWIKRNTEQSLWNWRPRAEGAK